MIQVTKFDPILRKKVTLNIPITWQEYAVVSARIVPIQEIVPNLPADLREFLISGISPEGWQQYEKRLET